MLWRGSDGGRRIRRHAKIEKRNLKNSANKAGE
jgi:hypothetical protein